MSIVAAGQITLVDYNDAVSLNGYIGSNQPLTQIYTQDTLSYVPNWTSSPYLKLTPQLFKSGSGTDIMVAGTGVQSVTWTSNGEAITLDTNHVKNASAPFDLTIKQNELASIAQKNYECTIVWRDPNTSLDITVKASISFSKMTNPGSLITAICYAPSGTLFKNGDVSSLKAHCDFWRGASIDSSNVTYQWFKNDASVTATSSTNYHANGGLGWGLISATNTYNGITNYTTNEITIPNATVFNYATFKCACTDTDSTSTTYNQVVKDTISYADQSDPIQVVVNASAGTVLKNGAGSTTLTAELWRAGEKIDTSHNGYTYTWTKLNNTGVPVNFYGTSSSTKSSYSITVDGNDVDGKNVFTIDVSTLT
jgi:hypothetical protein